MNGRWLFAAQAAADYALQPPQTGVVGQGAIPLFTLVNVPVDQGFRKEIGFLLDVRMTIDRWPSILVFPRP